MNVAFIETRDFSAHLEDYGGTDEHYLKMQSAILRNPDSGAVIPWTGGRRKIRWPDPRRGKGKRGGLRVIYLHIPEGRIVVLLDVYDKDEADDLSPDMKKLLAAEASQLRQYYAKRN